MTNPQHDSSQGHSALYERAWNDAAFASRLDRDPKAAIEEIYGSLPEDLQVCVVRDTAETKYLHIPAAPVDRELSDADLIGAQGGTTWVCVGTIVSAASAISIEITL